MSATVAEIIKIMDQLAPPLLAEEWDNVGLQIGDPRLPVRRIWVALDPSPEVVKAACQKEVDLLITHHPLIFRPLKSIDFETPGGSIIQMAAHRQLAIFSAHTNLDIVRDGVNDVLAQRLGLRNLAVLQPIQAGERVKGDIRTRQGRLVIPDSGGDSAIVLMADGDNHIIKIHLG